MMNNRKIPAIVLAFVFVPFLASAGGQEEIADEPNRSDTTATDTSADLSDQQIAEIKEILSDIGIQTFRGDIEAVDFTLPVLDGGSMGLSDLSDTFVFLNFWATWCPPCREEMPSMEFLHNTLIDTPFEIVAINVREDQETVQTFIDEFGYTYPILLDGDGKVSTNYSVRGIPTTYFIAPGGTVVGMLVGTRYWDEAETLAGMERIAEIVTQR